MRGLSLRAVDNFDSARLRQCGVNGFLQHAQVQGVTGFLEVVQLPFGFEVRPVLLLRLLFVGRLFRFER